MSLTRILYVIEMFNLKECLFFPFSFRDPNLVLHYLSLMSLGGVIALAMELAEFLLLQTTSR